MLASALGLLGAMWTTTQTAAGRSAGESGTTRREYSRPRPRKHRLRRDHAAPHPSVESIHFNHTSVRSVMSAHHLSGRPRPPANKQFSGEQHRLGKPGGAHSISSIRRFVATPPGAEHPWSAPDAASTRWHGTMIGNGFCASAAPTARAAPGSPIVRASLPCRWRWCPADLRGSRRRPPA